MKIRAFFISALILLGIAATFSLVEARQLFANKNRMPADTENPVTPRLIQSLITKMKNQLEKNDETFPELIKETENCAYNCKDSASAALLHSMVAEMYHSYYNRNRWNIDQRTRLADFQPEDIREWSSNLFEEKIKEEIAHSLQPARLLQTTPVDSYKTILIEGMDNNLRPTLYDFLMGRAISMRPDTAYYRQWEEFRKEQGNTTAWLEVRLSQLHYLQEHKFITGESYGNELEHLVKENATLPFVNEVRVAQTTYLYRLAMNEQGAQRKALLQQVLTLCEEGIRQYPEARATARLHNMQQNLTQPMLNSSYPYQLYPGQPLSINIRYKNTPQLTVRIYKSKRKVEDAWKNMYKQTRALRGTLVKEYRLSGDLSDSYTEKDSTFTLPVDLPLGLYECEVSADDKKVTNRYCFSISRLATIYRNLENGQKEVLITDSRSGEPLSGVTVYYYRPQKGTGTLYQAGQIKTNRSGLALLPNMKDMECLRPVTGADSSAVWSPVYGYSFHPSDNNAKTELSLFTDRGLYRPGQTVFVKGIAYIRDYASPHVAPQQTVELSLRDANGEEISKKSFTTDRFGAFNAEFTLPKTGLSGTYTLIPSIGYSYSFRVEEYKRPTFRLEIEPITEEAAFGNKLTLKGKASTYSGVSLTQGEVKWHIIERPFWLRLFVPYQNRQPRQVAEGKTTLNEQGMFNINFTPENELSEEMKQPVAKNYELIATLTDSKGETQEVHYTFAVSDVGMILQIDMADQLEASEAKATFKASNINRQPMEASGEYTLYTLSEKAAKSKNRWSKEEYAVTGIQGKGNFHTKETLDASFFEKLKSGRYRLEIKAKDKNGKEVTANHTFVLYRKEDKRPPVFSALWTVEEKTHCLPGEEASFVFGTSYENTPILYELYNSDAKRIRQEWIRLSNENRQFSIPFEPHYGNGVTVCFTFVREGQLYTKQIAIQLKQPDRQLRILPTTFRDHLLPGSNEQWTFRIETADSTKISAQVLAGMYDASLDKLMPFRWNFQPEAHLTLQYPVFRKGSSFQSSSDYTTADIKPHTIRPLNFDKLDWQGLLKQYEHRNIFALRGNRLNMAAGTKAMPKVMEEMEVRDDATVMITEEEVEKDNSYGNSPSTVQLRENFAETAFFYPALVTGPDGEVAFSFTLPESNTTWKLQLLAQSEDLKYGYLSKEIITSKPLMVVPNLPRFMRQGDEVSISTQVINQSDKEMTGRVRLELLDPETEQPVVCLTKSQKPFTLAAGGQTSVAWTLPVPSHIQLVNCRIVAETEEGSDGEQHLLPILSNRLLLTESQPFYLLKEGEQTIEIPQEKGATPFRYTLEVSANPIWYAVQALPTLGQPANDNIVSWFASYYSNTLAGHIAMAYPRIQKMIQQWSTEGGNASTLYSNLEKNSELKTILLEETPWVMEARNETEQKQRLELLFDLNRAAGQQKAALQQLAEKQNKDGGWGWLNGLGSDRSITLSILKGMAQLTELNAIQYGETERVMQMNALKFLDERIQKDYELLKRYRSDWEEAELSPEQADYLFVRSCYRDIPELGSAREAIRFYTQQAARYWKKMPLYNKGEIALLMAANGNREVADKIVGWLEKTATTSKEKGMYWANNRIENNYFISPIETHCLLMSMFEKLKKENSPTDRLKQWLLNQKRTQNWESEPATVNAIYALLLTGSNWLDEKNNCYIQWGKQSLTTTQGEVATGYLQKVISQEEITPQMQTLSIRKEGNAPAWGAVYNQYFQEIDKINGKKGVLNVEKRLFVETNNGNHLQISPIEPGEALKTGDKVIVRLVIRSDRDMDYVVLKDLRAGCFEPASQLSGFKQQDGLVYYHAPEDVSENFFFNHLPQGTYVLEYGAYVTRTGEYAGGISTIQCLYAPEFVSHTEGSKVTVK